MQFQKRTFVNCKFLEIIFDYNNYFMIYYNENRFLDIL